MIEATALLEISEEPRSDSIESDSVFLQASDLIVSTLSRPIRSFGSRMRPHKGEHFVCEIVRTMDSPLAQADVLFLEDTVSPSSATLYYVEFEEGLGNESLVESINGEVEQFSVTLHFTSVARGEPVFYLDEETLLDDLDDES